MKAALALSASPAQHTPVGAEFAALRARRRARTKAQATVGALAAQGTLGANLIADIGSAPCAASVDAGEKPRR